MARDQLGAVDRDGEADSLRGQYDRGVDADYLAARVDQRSAGVTGIERGVGLNDVVDQAPRTRPERTAERAHHARGNGALEAVRISYRDRKLADANRLRDRKSV